jgi:hypothetical protein
MDWDDPAARAELAERVGIDRYNELVAQFQRDSVLVTIHGHEIRARRSARFGTIYTVDHDIGFASLETAKAWCRANPKGK